MQDNNMREYSTPRIENQMCITEKIFCPSVFILVFNSPEACLSGCLKILGHPSCLALACHRGRYLSELIRERS